MADRHYGTKLLTLSHLLLTFSLTQRGTHSSRLAHERTYTHSTRERRMRGIIQTFAHAHALAHSLRHMHTRTNQTLWNVCFLEKEPAGLSTCLSALKSARVSDELWQKSGREGARARGHEAQEPASGNMACERQAGGSSPLQPPPPCSRPIVKVKSLTH